MGKLLHWSEYLIKRMNDSRHLIYTHTKVIQIETKCRIISEKL